MKAGLQNPERRKDPTGASVTMIGKSHHFFRSLRENRHSMRCSQRERALLLVPIMEHGECLISCCCPLLKKTVIESFVENQSPKRVNNYVEERSFGNDQPTLTE